MEGGMEGLFPGGRLCHDGPSNSIPDLDSLKTASRAGDRCVVVFIVCIVSWWCTGPTVLAVAFSSRDPLTNFNGQRIALPT